jgi:hypothetical protein
MKQRRTTFTFFLVALASFTLLVDTLPTDNVDTKSVTEEVTCRNTAYEYVLQS